MTDLTAERDYFRRMATAEHKPECPSLARVPWGRRRKACPGGHTGCNPPADRALFARLADEYDAYLTPADQPLLED